MKRELLFLQILLCLLLAGCYEDRTELTLRPDGSGTVRTKLVLSERFVTAAAEGASNEKAPPVDKEQVRKQVAEAVEITSLTQSDLPDGGRVIELEGTFARPERFFLSDFCQKTLNLRLSSTPSGKAVIYCETAESMASPEAGMSVTKLYGLAKGLNIVRTVHLPAKIEETNGSLGEDGRTVSWAFDLRDRQALVRTKKFVEGKDKGKGFAVFDASALEFPLPLKPPVVAQKPEEGKEQAVAGDANDIKADVVKIAVEKTLGLQGDSEPEYSALELTIQVSWPEASKPYAAKSAVLTNITDDVGNDLVRTPGSSFKFEIHGSQAQKQLRVRAKPPGRGAKELLDIRGYVPVVTSVDKKTVELENIAELAGKEATGNPVLDKMNFKVISAAGNSLKIEADGGNDRIASLELLRKDGSKLRRRGGHGFGDQYTYDFAEPVSEASTCRLEVIVSEHVVKVPFSLERVRLP